MGEKRKRSESADPEVETALVLRSVEETPEKKVKVESEDLGSPKPLTRKNLALLEGKMTPNTRSGGKNASNRSGQTGEKSVPDSTQTNSHTTNDPGHVYAMLKFNGLLMDDDAGLKTKRGKIIMEKALATITKQRKSPASQRFIDLFPKDLKKHKFDNEATFIDVIWWILVREDRTREVDPDSRDAEVLVKSWAPVEWRVDHLRHNRSQKFKNGYLPNFDTEGEKVLEKLLQKRDGMTTPEPDLAYGLDEEAFDDVQKEAIRLQEDLVGISNNIHFPWVIVEFKNYKGNIAEARNQANRGGATIIHTMDILKEKLGMSDSEDDVNDGSLVFSLVMDTDLAEIYVHSSERRVVRKKVKIFYHMNRLTGYFLNDIESVNKLRIAINNILDWGVRSRSTFVKGLLDEVAEQAGESEESTQEEPDGKGKGSSLGGKGTKKS